MNGWPRAIVVQHPRSARSRHGRRCADRKSTQVVRKRKRKIVEERGSLEKLVGGVMYLLRRS